MKPNKLVKFKLEKLRVHKAVPVMNILCLGKITGYELIKNISRGIHHKSFLH